jgi:hypothetical protein
MMKEIRIRVISMEGKVEDRTHRAPRNMEFTPKGINDILEETKKAIRRKFAGIKYAVAQVGEAEFVFAPAYALNERDCPQLKKVGEPATVAQGIKAINVRIVSPRDGREQAREFPAPEGKCFERSGIKRVLDAIVEYCKKEFPLTNFVVFEEGPGEFAFVPEQAVDKKAVSKAVNAAVGRMTIHSGSLN